VITICSADVGVAEHQIDLHEISADQYPYKLCYVPRDAIM